MKTRIVTLFLAMGAVLPTMAQYPVVTPEAQAHYDSLQRVWTAHSDSAWAVAFPTVKREAMAGRPYVPWASRPYDLRQAKIPAFPGAEGGGMFTFGGRGGRVLVVDNLNDAGPGSFRWACEQGGARVIVFNVSGVIWLHSPIVVRAPYVTIAGQTAPGDGVCVAGESFQVDTHDVIVRHMRFRRGNTHVWYREDSFGGNPVGNIMIDHCSCEWGLDENISFYRHMFSLGGDDGRHKEPTVNVTIQNTISAKALDTYNHAFGSTIGGENASFMRNLWADNTGRNPSVGWGGVFNFVNNVVYNWLHRTADGGDYATMFNMVNNYYKPGPATPRDKAVGWRIVKSESRSGQLFPYPQFGRVYAAGNIVEGNERVTRDNWDGGIQTSGEAGADAMALMRADEPFAMPPMTILPAAVAYDYVLAHAGATIPRRDAVDERVVDEVRTGRAFYVDPLPETHPYGDLWGLAPQSQDSEGHFKYRRMGKDSYKLGIITDPGQMGGYPTYKGKPRKDSDGDGMPDKWERDNGLDPYDPSDANGDINGDGYTNIEKYINGIDTRKKVDWTDLKNNHDTLEERGGVD